MLLEYFTGWHTHANLANVIFIQFKVKLLLGVAGADLAAINAYKWLRFEYGAP